MKKIKISFLVLSMLMFFSTCKKENLCDCFKGTGKQTSESRSLAPFTEVFIQDKIEVHLIEGNEYAVRIEAGEHLVKLIKTTVENNKLTIKNNNKCDFTRSYKRKIVVYVTLPKLRKLTNDGVSTVYMDSRFKCDTLNYSASNAGDLHLNLDATIVYGGMHGVGDVYMEGIVYESCVYATGQGHFHGYNVAAQRVILTLKTSGKMEVNANALLKIDTYQKSTGDVYYKGSPNIIANTNASVEVINAN